MKEQTAQQSAFLWYVLSFLAVVICVMIPVFILVGLFYEEELAVMFASAREKGNLPPVASFSVVPREGTTDTVFTFDATASSDQEDGSEKISIRWDPENDGTFQPWTSEKTCKYRYPTAGNYTVKLEVKDSAGGVGSVTHKVPVAPDPNTPPSITAVKAEGNPGKTRDPRKFREYILEAACSDKEESPDKLQVRWDVKGDDTWTEYSSEKKLRHVFPAYGSYTVMLEVRDSKGAKTSSSVAVKTPAPKKIPPAKHQNIKLEASCTSNCHTNMRHDEVGNCLDCHVWPK